LVATESFAHINHAAPVRGNRVLELIGDCWGVRENSYILALTQSLSQLLTFCR
jgi:hypothetical protein